MRNKYTKAELVALVQVKLIGLGMKITQQDITKILNTYEHTIYEVLENGSPATLGCLGSFRFKTVAERFDDNSCVPPSPAYTGVKFRVNNDLKKSIREKTRGNPWDIYTKYTEKELDKLDKEKKDME